jgi:hypothetical protein
MSSESLRRVVGDRSLDNGLGGIGVTVSSGLFRIEIEDGEVELKFPGWSHVYGGDGDDEGDSELWLVPDCQ